MHLLRAGSANSAAVSASALASSSSSFASSSSSSARLLSSLPRSGVRSQLLSGGASTLQQRSLHVPSKSTLSTRDTAATSIARASQLGRLSPLLCHATRVGSNSRLTPLRASPFPSSVRFASSVPDHHELRWYERLLIRVPILRWFLWGTFSIVFGITASIAIILAHDALTYSHVQLDHIKASPLALHPEPGGPKNLPIVSDYVEGDESDVTKKLKDKPKLVIVGGGWAAVSLLSKLDAEKYNITLVAPNNYYLFTPLLPSATVGTVEPRSLIEPLRKVLSRHHGHYIQGKAVDVEFGGPADAEAGSDGAQRYLEVQLVSGEEKSGMPGRSHPEAEGGVAVPSRDEVKNRKVYVPYDKLVVAVGAVTSTHGVPGLEHAFHLKEIDDARGIRNRILDNLEIASLPTTTPEERERLMSFVISGGGPTGVETASEIYDMLNEDVLDYFPKLLRQRARVHLIQSRSHILNTYSEHISQYAEDKFMRDEVDVVLNARVKEVKPDSVVYTTKDDQGKVQEHEIPSGMTLWSTGIAMSPFTKHMVNILPNQSHLKALMVDSHMRVQGTPKGTVYALGDASTIDTRLIDSLYDFVDTCDTDSDGRLNFKEFQALAGHVGRRFPLASKHFTKLQEMFNTYDRDHDGSLSLNEIADLFMETQQKMTALPATAQVAAQQGAYLGKKLNKLAKLREAGTLLPRDGSSANHDSDSSTSSSTTTSPPPQSPHTANLDIDDMHYRTFEYRNLGSLAYIGNAAAFDLPMPEPLRSWAGGLIAMYAWRGFYLSEQVSMRTRMLLLSDYIRRGIWGRDISRI